MKHIFVINLKERKDLLDKIEYLFEYIKNNTEIKIRIIEGINIIEEVKQNPLEFNKFLKDGTISLGANGMRKNKFSLLGEIGCYLSHKKCWNTIISENLQDTLILEDGIHFDKDRFKTHSKVFKKLKKEYDILFVNKEMNVFNEQNAICGVGTQGYILSNSGAKKLLLNCKSMYLPIDLQIRHLCNTNKLNYLFSPYFVERNNDRTSSIGDKHIPDNLKSKQDLKQLQSRIIINMLQKNIPIIDYI